MDNSLVWYSVRVYHIKNNRIIKINLMKIKSGLYKGWTGSKTAPSAYRKRERVSSSYFQKNGYIWNGNRKTGVGGWFKP